MQPRFIELPEKRVIGLGADFISILVPGGNTQDIIPALWDRFMKRMPEIPGSVSGASYGLVEMLPDAAAPGELFYIACVEVKDFDSAPADMLQRTIPAGRHAVFTHKGPLARLCDTMKQIYEVWLPQSAIKLREAPHIEAYDRRFNPMSEDSEFDILLPV